MGQKTRAELKNTFKTGDKPTQANFEDLIDSQYNKSDDAGNLMSASDKTKLDTVAEYATRNDTDANLKSRTNHTGTQSADTVTDGTTNKAYTAIEKTKLAGIAAGAQMNPTQVSAGEITAGTETGVRGFSPKDVADMAGIHGGGGGGGSVSSVGGTAPIASSGGDNPVISITAATGSAAGSMSADDKTKLDGIDAGAEVNVQPDWDQDDTDQDDFIKNKPINATPSAAGFMSASDKTRLDGIESGATADQTASEIESAYNSQVSQVSSGEKTAGTETGVRRFSPKDVADMAGIHGGGGGSVETVDSLFDVLLPVILRNTQGNNVTLTGETRYQITAIDTVNKQITISPSLPYTILHSTSDENKKWTLCKDPGIGCDVVAYDFVNNKITYSTMDGVLAVNNNVMFFNPFRKGEILSYNPLLDTQTGWASLFVQPAGMWKHSDGTYRMIINGKNSVSPKPVTIGLAQSSDLVNWSYVSGNPRYQGNVAPFNKSWCAQSTFLFSNANPLKIEDSNYYYLLLNGVNSSGNVECGLCVIDEDFNILKVFDNPIVIPDHPNTEGNYAGAIVWHENKYKIFVTHRETTDPLDWTTYELEMADIETLAVANVSEVITGTGTGSWHGKHCDTVGAIVYKGKLFVFAGGTGIDDSTQSGVLAGNRTWGLLTKEAGVWKPYEGSPVLSNPINGYDYWPDVLMWCYDHVGGYFSSIIENNYLYIYNSWSAGTDSYKVAGMKFDLRK